MSRRLFNPCRAFPALAGLLFASCILGQAQTAGVIAHPTQVSVGGQTLTLAAGQPVTVMSASGNTATVRVVLANGTVAMLQVPASALTSAQFSPSHATTPPTTLRVSTPLPPAPRPVTPAAMLATPEVDTKPGWRHLKFRELPVPPDKPPFLNYTFTPKDERFEVYIPRTYRPDRPCGLLGWITPSDEIPTPRRFAPLFDEFRLIVLSAARCGNDAETDRRLGLLACGALQLSKSLAIDPRRRLLSGLSGGGRESAVGCFVQPEFWCGAVSWCGGMYYEDYPASEKPGLHHRGINHDFAGGVTPALVAAARRNTKFVLITGSNDFNYGDSQDLERALRKDGFRVLLVDERGLGHQIGSVVSMRKGLEFVLGPPPAF